MLHEKNLIDKELTLYSRFQGKGGTSIDKLIEVLDLFSNI